MSVAITEVIKGSPAARAGIRAGQILLSINGHDICDVLDYQFYAAETKLSLLLSCEGDRLSTVIVKKTECEDLGLCFDTYLMDRQKSCKNKCIFCFIDQLPEGMRESLYFKDDDSRLSFLFGNYITLTNLTQRDINRIIEMKISPVNVSVHTTNADLRASMMRNPAAASSLNYLTQLTQAGIAVNCQLVLCPGYNDGKELSRTLNDLAQQYPALQSVAVVPVGLTKHRIGLVPIEPYTKESAAQVVADVERFQQSFIKEHGTRFAFVADEFYLKANLPIPNYDYYEEFTQLENGVGLITLLKEEFIDALNEEKTFGQKRPVSIVTGTAARPVVQELVDRLAEKCEGLCCHIYAIENHFFGTSINVAGLVTGQDIMDQLAGKELGDALLFPSVMLRHEGDMFLDDVTPDQLSQALGVPAIAVQNSGQALLDAILG